MDRSTIPSEFSHQRKKVEIYGYSVLVGVLSGFIIVGYRASIAFLEANRSGFMSRYNKAPLSVIIWIASAATFGFLVALLVKAAPYIKGSGIPQVKASLMRRIQQNWKKEIPAKFLGGSLALGTGFSLGREGPSIQLGALTGEAVSDLIHRSEYRRYLVTAGAAAGISAAFNAPLAGVLFCIEELHKNVSPTMLTSSLIASFSANAVMWGFYGNSPVFGIELAQALPLNMYFSSILFIGILTGLFGKLFNGGLLGFQSLYRRVTASQTSRLVSAFIIVAGISLALPVLTGGGDKLIDLLQHAEFPLWTIIALLAGKMVFTLFCYASGAPGGIFLPMLATGALLGALSHSLLGFMGVPPGYLENYILIGMVGFFTAVVRAPITGAVLITEMAGSFAHFPAFMFVSVIASLVSGLLGNKPIYDSLLAQVVQEPLKAEGSRPVLLYIPVLEGSILETCTHVQERLPEGCILVSVEHGEEDIYPHDDLDIQPGDMLRIVVESRKAGSLKEQLIGLGQASSDCLDGE
jgi:H+/Cl- antiporter ClcA